MLQALGSRVSCPFMNHGRAFLRRSVGPGLRVPSSCWIPGGSHIFPLIRASRDPTL